MTTLGGAAEDAAASAEGGAGGLGGILGGRGQIIEFVFVWGIVNQVLQALLAPVFDKLRQEVLALATTTPLSPADLADLVLRGWVEQDTGAAQARLAGLAPEDFDLMVKGTGEPPGLETVLQWYRRGIVPFDSTPGVASVLEAVRTSRIFTKVWATAIRQGNVVPIPAAEMVDALVEAQTTAGTRDAVLASAAGVGETTIDPAATTFYEVMWANGYTPAQADLMFHTRGNPPAPSELITLFRRGVIPWTGTGQTATTVQQGIYEGATKDKWFPKFAGLVRAIPALYEIRLMLSKGAFTEEQAVQFLLDSGYTQDVAEGVLAAATAVATATDRKLAKATITSLYLDQAITRDEAKTLLVDIGYGTKAATFVLQVVDMTREAKALASGIAKIETYFVARKLSPTAAKAALMSYNVPSAQAEALIAEWTVARTSNVKILTEAQITDGWEYGALDAQQCFTYLQAIGYTARDAWTLMVIKAKGPIKTLPEPPAEPSLQGTIT